MRLDGVHLELASTIIDSGKGERLGWRRCIEVREDSVFVSRLMPPEAPGSKGVKPEPEIAVWCKPEKLGPVGSVSRMGWLALDGLEPVRTYWLKLRTPGVISVEQEGGKLAVHWHLPARRSGGF